MVTDEVSDLCRAHINPHETMISIFVGQKTLDQVIIENKTVLREYCNIFELSVSSIMQSLQLDDEESKKLI